MSVVNLFASRLCTYPGGRTFGVAKEVELVAVKVFGGNGLCRFGDVIAAIDFVVDEKMLDPGQPMVINLSLGTPRVAKLLNQAVDRAVQANITVVVAAGNGGVDACTYSPASSALAITVAASTRNEYVVSDIPSQTRSLYLFRNYSHHLDLYCCCCCCFVTVAPFLPRATGVTALTSLHQVIAFGRHGSESKITRPCHCREPRLRHHL